jgi:hypothetical protein
VRLELVARKIAREERLLTTHASECRHENRRESRHASRHESRRGPDRHTHGHAW